MREASSHLNTDMIVSKLMPVAGSSQRRDENNSGSAEAVGDSSQEYFYETPGWEQQQSGELNAPTKLSVVSTSSSRDLFKAFRDWGEGIFYIRASETSGRKTILFVRPISGRPQ